MEYLHTMIRIRNIEESLKFFCDGLGLVETRRTESEKGRFTLIFLAAPVMSSMRRRIVRRNSNSPSTGMMRNTRAGAISATSPTV